MASWRIEKVGVVHSYSINAESLTYQRTGASPFHKVAAWATARGLTQKHGKLIFRFAAPARANEIPIELSAEHLREFLGACFQAWKASDRGAALKSLHDYVHDRRTVSFVLVVISLIFPGLLAALLLLDGFNTHHCTSLLQNGVAVTGSVSKSKKDRRGNFVWTVDFKTTDDQLIHGKRTALTDLPEASAERPGTATVVYSPAEPKCWDLSLRQGEALPNLRQRYFSFTMATGFGSALGIVALLGCVTGILGALRKQPALSELKQILAEL